MFIDPIQLDKERTAFDANQQGQNESLRERLEEFNRLISEGKIKPPGWLPHANLWEGDFATNVYENMRYLASIGWKQPKKENKWIKPLSTVLSAVTGGMSDIGFSAYNTIANSTGRDWEKLFTGGFSELSRGVKDHKPLKGLTNMLLGVVDNPLINFSDDFLTSTGTMPQRVLRDVGVMPEDIYQKNYDYTGLIAHLVGSVFAGGASSALPAGGGAVEGISAGAGTLPASMGNAEYAANIIADMQGNAAYNAAIKAGETAGSAASAAESAAAAYMKTYANQALLNLGKDIGGKAITKILTGELLGGSAEQANTYRPSFSAPDTPPAYSIGGLLNTPRPQNYIQPESQLNTPSFEKTAIPKLSDYGDDKKKKLAEILTNPYKNYALNDYALYKADPEKLQELIGSQYLA